MANELDIIKTEIAVKSANRLADIVKPLVKEIHLFDTYISGTSHIDRSILNTLHNDQKLILQREDSKFDDNSILILTENKQKIGYIPEADNIIFSRLMDAGKLLTAKIESINLKGDWYKIRIKIYLMDM